MTIKEIAELCGVDKVTVYRWVENQNFLSCKMQLRNTILEKIKKGSPERPSDFSLEETLAIIGDGGGNKTLAALLEENSKNKNALSIAGSGNGAVQILNKFNDRLERMEKAIARIEKGQNTQSGFISEKGREEFYEKLGLFGGFFKELNKRGERK